MLPRQSAAAFNPLIDALTDVLCFGLNAIFSHERDTVARLAPDTLNGSRGTNASSLVRRTFDAHRFVTSEELDEFREFTTRLLAHRNHQDRHDGPGVPR